MSGAFRGTVFLDRDGTINVEKNYLHRIEDFAFISGAPEAIARLNAAGLRVVVVTNQAGIARGRYTEADVEALHEYMQNALEPAGARVDAYYYSPFHPEGTVEQYRCNHHDRKPNPGMFERAIREHNIPAANRFVVGDRLNDLSAGTKAGCEAVLVRTGYGAEEEARIEGTGVRVDHVADDLADAAGWILARVAV